MLAARTRDTTFGPQLIALANNTSANWQLRRAAIHAAGFLPFGAALAHMLAVLRDRSPLTIDGHQDLYTHATLSSLLLFEAPGLLSRFRAGRARFVALVEDILGEARHGLIDSRGWPPAAETAGWLYERLKEHGWPGNPDAPDAVINELHVPLLHSAILRALRRVGSVDPIEAELARANHVWMATKCLLERTRAGQWDAGLVARLTRLVEHSPVAGDPRLERIIANLTEREPQTCSSRRQL